MADQTTVSPSNQNHTLKQRRLKLNADMLFLIAVTAVLLIAAYLRYRNIVAFMEWPDEIWSLWHVRGNFDVAMSRIPYDWPPVYSLLAWAWMQLVGETLEASRGLMILISMLALSVNYRAAYALFTFHAKIPATQARLAAVVSATTFAVMGYAVFSGVEVRAYGLLILLGSLALWLSLRWLRRPTIKRGVAVSLALAALMYTSYTSVIFIGVISLMALIFRPRLFLKWIGILIGAGILLLPLIIPFLSNAGRRLDTMYMPVAPVLEAMSALYGQFGGSGIFVVLLLIAVILTILWAIRYPSQRQLALFLLIWVLAPFAAYFVLRHREFITTRYLWWVMPGLALTVGFATLYLPRILRMIAPFAVLLLAFVPVDYSMYRIASTEAAPMRMVLSWFADHIRPGDIVIRDPYCVCGVEMAWDYFLPHYFPEGTLPWASEPGDASRVWYLATTGWEQDEELIAQIEDGRKPSIFVGPWNFLLRLYEGPPLWEGVSFGDQINFHGFEIEGNRETFGENDDINLKLWWSAEQPLSADYSISIAVLDSNGNLIAQADGPATAPDTPSQTSAWQPGEYYQDIRSIHLPLETRFEDYSIVLTVYQWWDGVRLLPETNAHWGTLGEDGSYLHLKDISVISY